MVYQLKNNIIYDFICCVYHFLCVRFIDTCRIRWRTFLTLYRDKHLHEALYISQFNIHISSLYYIHKSETYIRNTYIKTRRYCMAFMLVYWYLSFFISEPAYRQSGGSYYWRNLILSYVIKKWNRNLRK